MFVRKKVHGCFDFTTWVVNDENDESIATVRKIDAPVRKTADFRFYESYVLAF